MTEVLPERLGPSTARVVLFFAAFFGVVLAPQVVLWGFVLFGPAPYVFEPSGFEESWVGVRRLPGRAELALTRFESSAEARTMLSRTDSAMPTSSHQILRNGRRYTRSDSGRAGVLVVFGPLLLQIEAADADSVERALTSLPFVRANPSPAAHVMDAIIGRWRTSLAALGVYVLLGLVFMGRAGSWAARTLPPAGTPPVDGDALRRALLAIGTLDVPLHVRETRRGSLVAEWRIADARWTSVLEKGGLTVTHRVTMKLDDRDHVVRSIDCSKQVRWRAGAASFGWSFSWFRGIVFGGFDAATDYGLLYTPNGWVVGPEYRYAYSLNELKAPIVRAVVMSGWTWRPVVTFIRFFGG